MNYLISRNTLIAAFALLFIATGLSFCFGYFMGTFEPREPTFAEREYHRMDTRVCEKCVTKCEKVRGL